MTRVLIANTLVAILAALLIAPAMAQVHYHDSGHPWEQRASGGPDAEVPGWYYNLGITGMRAELVADEPKSLVIRHVFANSSASGIVRVDDRIIGAGGQPFKEAHRNGYGEEVFGATGPISEFAAAQPKFATCSGDTKPPPGSARAARECPRGRGDQRRRRPLAV
jgi:hypothetical protein